MRWSRNIVARSLIASLLFAQAALALAACEWMRRAPALAIAQTGESARDSECPMLARSKNLCVAHCLSEDQSLDKPSIAMPVLAPAPAFAIHAVAPKPHHSVRPAGLIPPAIGPPIHIRFQSFLL